MNFVNIVNFICAGKIKLYKKNFAAFSKRNLLLKKVIANLNSKEETLNIQLPSSKTVTSIV